MNCKLCGSDQHSTEECSPVVRQIEGRMEAGASVEQFEAGEREYARDLFAAGAMQALVEVRAANNLVAYSITALAIEAYDIADAMMAERDKRRQASG